MIDLYESIFDSLQTSQHYLFKSSLEKVADWFLTPVRYLLSGREVYIIPTVIEGKFSVNFEEWASFTESSFTQTVLAIAALIPGLLIGSLLKLCSTFDQNHQWVAGLSHNINKQEARIANIYFMVDPRIMSSGQDPIYWDLVKRRCEFGSYAEIKPSEKGYDRAENDLYCIFARRNGRTTNIFHLDGQFPQATPLFLQCKNIKRKTLILDFTHCNEVPPGEPGNLERINEYMMSVWNHFDDLKEDLKISLDFTMEARSIENFQGAYLQ